MKRIKKFIRKFPFLFFFLYNLTIPIKKLKNKDLYKKQFIEIERNLLKNGNKIFYVGVPVHNNLGDLAQYYCIIKWLKENFSNYEIVEIPDNIIVTNYKKVLSKLSKSINQADFFVFQSGYRTTDVANFEGEFAHRKILKKFNNKVLVFPQTINFKTKREKKKSKNAYAKNGNYLFLARDEVSYQTACEIYDKNRVKLYPDIVTSMIGNCNLTKNSGPKDGILLCLRNDEEKLYTNEEYSNLIDELQKITNKIDLTDTNSAKNFELNRNETEMELQNKLQQFEKYKLVITDRYHGTIFSLVANTNVIVLNSTDHKLSSGVLWFKGVYDENVRFCDNLNDVYNLVSKMYSNKHNRKKEPYFKHKYYDLLKGRMENETKNQN